MNDNDNDVAFTGCDCEVAGRTRTHSKTWTDAIKCTKKCLHKLQSFPWHAVRTLAHMVALFTLECRECAACASFETGRTCAHRVTNSEVHVGGNARRHLASFAGQVHPLRVTGSVCFHTNLPISPFAFVEHISIYYLFSVFSQFSVLVTSPSPSPSPLKFSFPCSCRVLHISPTYSSDFRFHVDFFSLYQVTQISVFEVV